MEEEFITVPEAELRWPDLFDQAKSVPQFTDPDGNRWQRVTEPTSDPGGGWTRVLGYRRLPPPTAPR